MKGLCFKIGRYVFFNTFSLCFRLKFGIYNKILGYIFKAFLKRNFKYSKVALFSMKSHSKSFVKIAHISDLHFGRVWGAKQDRVKACKKSLKEFKPDMVLVTGDLALLGRISEFIQAREFLDSLPYEKVVVPGNHDVLDGLLLPKMNPFKRLRLYKQFLPFKNEIKIGNLQIIGMDSTTFYAIGRGHITIEEFSRFSKDKNVIKCLAMHHHVVAIPGTGEGNMISNVDQVIGEIIKHNIQYVFHGHRHKRMHFRLDSFVWDKRLDNPVDIFACGTTLTSRTRGKDSYSNYNQVIINTTVKRNSFSYVNMIFDKKKKEFVPRDQGFKTRGIKAIFEKDSFSK